MATTTILSQQQACNYMRELLSGTTVKGVDLTQKPQEVTKRLRALKAYADTLKNAKRQIKFLEKVATAEAKYSMRAEGSATRSAVISEADRVIKELGQKMDTLFASSTVDAVQVPVPDDEVLELPHFIVKRNARIPLRPSVPPNIKS